MTLDSLKFAAVVETAKQATANSAAWLRAIDRAAEEYRNAIFRRELQSPVSGGN